ncbi:MAG TPA: hypothetical protein VNL77_04160, partial [Roseiflexaceae bacterium]|nr:hypothetical protein [Roseiflexaceae bacterium]
MATIERALSAEVQRRQVQLAQLPAAMAPYLWELFGDGAASIPPECRILDMKYEPGEYCRILYQLGGRLIIGSFRWGADEGDLPENARLVEPLGMRAFLFQHDPALPGLATVLD